MAKIANKIENPAISPNFRRFPRPFPIPFSHPSPVHRPQPSPPVPRPCLVSVRPSTSITAFRRRPVIAQFAQFLPSSPRPPGRNCGKSLSYLFLRADVASFSAQSVYFTTTSAHRKHSRAYFPHLRPEIFLASVIGQPTLKTVSRLLLFHIIQLVSIPLIHRHFQLHSQQFPDKKKKLGRIHGIIPDI